MYEEVSSAVIAVVTSAVLMLRNLHSIHSVYDSWKSVNQTVISDNGEWISYTINPQQGDGWLYFITFHRKKGFCFKGILCCFFS